MLVNARLVKRVLGWIGKRKNSILTFDLDKQKRYLAHLGHPIDDIERSFFQYKCQMKLYGKVISCLINVFSFPMLLIFLLKYSQSDTVKGLHKADAVFISYGNSEKILPKALTSEFNSIVTVHDSAMRLTKGDKEYWSSNIYTRYRFSWYFHLKVLYKTAIYRNVLDLYSPKTIITCNEYSFTSSFLTAFCNHLDLEHINVMHGEKLYYIRDSYFRYDRCYVWDEHYSRLCESLGAERSQFYTAIPDSLLFQDFEYDVNQSKYDFTYYLQAENDQTLKLIANTLHSLVKLGYFVAYRPHPIYEHKATRYLLNGLEREDSSKVNIEESLKNTKHAVSRYSTVLYQAFVNGVLAVLDDLTDPVQFEALVKRNYIMIDVKHELLSGYLCANQVSAEI